MKPTLSQLLQNLLAAPFKDVADPADLTKQAQDEFNKGVVEHIDAIEKKLNITAPKLPTKDLPPKPSK